MAADDIGSEIDALTMPTLSEPQVVQPQVVQSEPVSRPSYVPLPEPDNTRKSTNTVRIVSYVIGGIALAMIIASVFLLIFVRDKTEVTATVHVSPTVIPPIGPIPEVALQVFNFDQDFTVSDFVNGVSVSPVASTGDVSPVLVSSSVTPVHDVTPNYEPGMLPFDSTNATPLQIPPQGFGYCVMTPDAAQWFTSMENGFALFAQFIYTQTNFQPNTDAYKSGENSIFFCKKDPADPKNDSTNGTNLLASSLGSVGYSSMAMSDDGTRIHIAHRDPLMGSGTNFQYFPFLQLAGQVATFTRPDGQSGSLPTSTSWTYSCELELANPYGGQTAQFNQVCDPITGLLLTGDDFGSIIKVSTNLTNGNRMVAVRANFGLRVQDGAFVTIYEETDNNVYNVSGIVQLYDGQTTFTSAEKTTFARDFAIGNDTLLCAVRTPTGGCGVTVVGYKILFYRRNDVTLQWDYKQTIEAPTTGFDFGVSIVMHPDGTQAIVGAPTLAVGNSPGIGGNLYFLQRSADGDSWAITQTLPDPFASVNSKGAFGYFLNTDKRFLVVSASANQNNVITVNKSSLLIQQTPVADKPKVVFMSINQKTGAIDPTNAQQITQDNTQPQQYLDPLFGARIGMEFVDEKSTTLRVVIGSPMNQTIGSYTMSVG